MFPKIMHVKVLEDYKLRLQYENGEIRLFDVLPYISGKWYEELRNYHYFKTVHLISEGKGIEWEHGQDIAPHELYDMSIISDGDM
jgi:hypothetical protein